MIADDRRKFCDRLRSYWKHTSAISSAIHRDRRRLQKIEPCSVFCDRLRSYENQSSATRDRNVSHNIFNSGRWFNASKPQSPHVRLRRRSFVLSMACIEYGNVTNDEFMEEVARYECVYNRNSKNFKDKNKKANSWEKIGEKFNFSRLFMNIFRIQNRCFLRFSSWRCRQFRTKRRNKFACSKL